MRLMKKLKYNWPVETLTVTFMVVKYMRSRNANSIVMIDSKEGSYLTKFILIKHFLRNLCELMEILKQSKSLCNLRANRLFVD